MLKVVEGDCKGTFHGLGSLLTKQRGGKRSAQVVLHRDFKIPLRILAEPGDWYSMHRKPTIAEINGTNDRVLVRFVACGRSGPIQGSCVYALRNGDWDCYTIKPSASETIATAEMWLNKRDWEDWG